MNKLFISVILVVILISNTFAESVTVPLNHNTQRLNIGKYLFYYEDKSNQAEFSEICSPAIDSQFIKSTQNILGLGLSNSTYWLKFQVEERDIIRNAWFLELTLASFNELTFFYQENGMWKEIKTGTNLPFNQRPIAYRFFTFPLKIKEINASQTFYIKVKTQRAYTLPLVIYQQGEFIKKIIQEEWLYGAFLGILVFISFYNLILFFVFREITYLCYVLYVFSSALLLLIYNGYLSQFLFSNIIVNANSLYFYVQLFQRSFIVIFAINFLEIKQKSPTLFKALITNLMVFPIIFLLHFWLKSTTIFELMLYVSSLTLGLSTLTGIYLWLMGKKQVRFYVIGYGFYFIGVLLNNLLFYRQIEANFFTIHGGEIGIFLEAFFLSLALGDKYRTEKTEARIAKEKAQDELILLQKETNEKLEQKVKERTLELQQKNEELNLQSEEVRSINDQLEKIVDERTKELKVTVENLLKQNEDLEQFSYIVSHNLRAPVARIQGLVNIFNKEDMNHELNKQILEHLSQSSYGLDMIIKDLTEVLTIRKNINTNREEIDIEAVIDSEITHLEEQIRNSEGIIIKELNIKSLLSVKIYLQSIVHNLLSNAVKYKYPDRKPVILIKTEQLGSSFVLIVEDNGLGVDTTDPYKIFGLYQRMHTHVEGKGLGLYLVKTQVETLNGSIEVESKLGQGSVFKVYLPISSLVGTDVS